MKNKIYNTTFNFFIQRGFNLKKGKLSSFNFDKLVNFLSSGLAFHEGDPDDLNIKYDEFYIHKVNLFNYLSVYHNFSLLYFKINKKDFDHDRKVNYFIEKNLNNITFNEQMHIKSRTGTQYMMVKYLSLLINYSDDTMGIVRIEFLNQKTAYADQGKIISILSSVIYVFLCQEHDILAMCDSSDVSKEKENKEAIKLISKRVKEIKRIALFREPGIGNVFGKREYQYSVNHYYTESLHRKYAIDSAQFSLIDALNKDRNQLLVNEYHRNIHEKYQRSSCYFDFIGAYLQIEDFDELIPDEIYENVIDFINRYYFDTVTEQQVLMYNMIKNRIQSAYTNKIQSCCYSYREYAEKKLREHIAIGNTKDISCITKFIKMLKDKARGRINPGSGYFYEMVGSDDFCDQYIVDHFAWTIPWMNAEDNLYFAKEYLTDMLGGEIYFNYQKKLDALLDKIFGPKGFLYGDTKYSRGVFYQEILKQFELFGEYEAKQREKGKEITIEDILKPSIRAKAKRSLNKNF